MKSILKQNRPARRHLSLAIAALLAPSAALAQQAPEPDSTDQAATLDTIQVRGEYIPEPMLQTSEVASFVTREDFEFEGNDHRGRLTAHMESGRMMQVLGLEPLDPEHDRAMICGSPQVLADIRSLLDARGFTPAPRIGVPGHYVFERAFVEK